MITVIFGPPGSGKGTQASRIAELAGLPHVSTGEILRAEVGAATPLGVEVGPIMKAGGLIPDGLMVRVVESRLAQDDALRGALLDGFPRTVPQAQALDTVLDDHGRAVELILFLDVPVDVLKARILRRGELDHRADDTAEAFAQRMQEYDAKTAPVIKHYQDRGTRIEWIGGDAPIDVVTDRILKVFGRTELAS